MKKIIWIIVALLVILGALYYAGVFGKRQQTPVPSPEIKDYPSYTMEEVVKHATSTDCWSVVYGKVYNITPFFGNHPGGDKTLNSMCGKDATEAFNNKHGMSKDALNGLLQLFIGNLGK